MVLHLDADRARAWLVSVPRDACVSAPGRCEDTIDAAYSKGGPALFVQTLERLTGLGMDHLVVIDWTGFRRLTDAVGGVPVALDAPGERIADPSSARVALEMSGGVALDYVSTRDALPGGDLDRMRRQHRYLRALFGQMLDRDALADTSALRGIAEGIGDALRVDAGLTPSELLGLLRSIGGLRPDDVTFLIAPVTGIVGQRSASTLRYDAALGGEMWRAMGRDSMPAFVAAHPELVTPPDVR